MTNTNRKIDRVISEKLLQLWRQIPNPDRAFLSRNGRSPYQVLHDLSYTAEVQSAILARESAVLGDPWEVICDSPSADFIRENLKQIDINSIFREIFKSVWYGYAVLQHPMEKINGKWIYTKINALPSDWFSFKSIGELIPTNHTDTSPINTLMGDLEKEVELVQYRPSFENPYGEGLLARVFWHATWIRGDMELWISYLDRFGDDSVIGRIDIADDKKKFQFLQAIADFKSSGAIVIEGTDSVDTIKTDKSGSSSLFKNFHEICSQQISKLILGHASALEAQTGKLGNDESLSVVRQDITQGDKSLIQETINRLIKHLCLVNNIKDEVRFFFTPEKEDEKARIERDQKLFAIGYEFSEEYIRKTYRFAEDEIKKLVPQSITNFSERPSSPSLGRSL
ncbi:MAG: phage portal protein family protein [Brevinema sp.]